MATLPLIRVKGSNYDVGFSIGQAGKSVLKKIMDNDKNFNERHLAFVASDRGRAVFDNYLEEAEEAFPHYVEEIKGIAEGAGINFGHVFVWHLFTELDAHCDAAEMEYHHQRHSHEHAGAGAGAGAAGGAGAKAEGCTTIMVHTHQGGILGHNEDMDKDKLEGCFILDAEIVPSEKNGDTHERYVCFVYPGSIAGYAFGFNQHGLCMSGNELVPETNLQNNWLPRAILLRSLLRATCASDVISTVQSASPGIGGGFHLNLAQGSGDASCHMTSLEMFGAKDGRNECDVKDIDKTEVHRYCNIYNRMNHKGDHPSSVFRHQRLSELLEPPPRAPSDVLRILADRANTEYPIFRNGDPPDLIFTGATALYDIGEQTMKVYSGYPDRTLLYTFDIKTGSVTEQNQKL